jgi:hypothetical protein
MAVRSALGSPVMHGGGLLVYWDVAEPPCGHPYVLWQYLYDLLAVQAGQDTGEDFG